MRDSGGSLRQMAGGLLRTDGSNSKGVRWRVAGWQYLTRGQELKGTDISEGISQKRVAVARLGHTVTCGGRERLPILGSFLSLVHEGVHFHLMPGVLSTKTTGFLSYAYM